ncbi:MAG: ribonuclease III [Spirochaetaceae bacterium]|nr:ribonuclease III [Spirochaetaceae bacterium]
MGGVLPAPGPERKQQLAVFLKTSRLRFRNQKLLDQAFVHRSVSNESAYRSNNERLEFLGDAILGAVTAALLYEEMPDKPEGELAKIKSVVVSENVLAAVARELQINTVLLLGRGEELSGGREKNAILADTLEALIGALYLDSGYKAAFVFISRWMRVEIHRVQDNRSYRDYKSLLQEMTQRLFRSYPVYRLVKRSGPDHEHIFWMEVKINGEVFGPGMGKNKKSAEQEAARIAYLAFAEVTRTNSQERRAST